MISVAGALGIGSGIDTQRLVADLAAAQRAPRDAAIAQRSERNQARISALSQVRSGLDGLTRALSSLARSGALGPQPRSSDAAAIGLTIAPGAAVQPFTRTVEVSRLASAQTLSSRRYASASEPVGFGTLTIELGTATTSAGAITGFAADAARPAKTITIDAGKDSLAGVRDAINAAGAGLSASIVNDGDGVRLQVRGESGAANAFRITAATAPGSPAADGLSDLSFAPGASTMQLSTTAVNAALVVDGLAVERSTNLISDLVDGYTVELKRAGVGTPVTLSADRDPFQLADVAQSFVDAFNEVQALVAEAGRGRTATSEAGPLFGQSAIRSLSDQLAQLTSRPLATGAGSVTLAEIGVRTERNGTLSIDRATLDAAIARDPTMFEKLFAPSQAASESGVTILSALTATKPGTYQVTGATPATSGQYAGLAVPTAFDFPVDVDALNSSFTLELDGAAPVTLSLPVGSYVTGSSLAAAFESAINSSPALVPPGTRVRVGWDAGSFRFLSLSLGARSNIQVSGMDAVLAARLGLDAGTRTDGVSAAGTIAGVAAIGNGSRLSASASSAASGLSLELGATTPSTFSVTVGEGLSGAIARIQDSLDGSDGGLSAAASRFQREAEALGDESDVIARRSEEYTASLSRQFAAMERAVASYRSIGDFLTQQIDAWTNQDR